MTSVGRPQTAVALLSGGLDSGTAVAMWLAEGHAVVRALFVDYGQRAAARERRAAGRLARRWSLEFDEIGLVSLAEAARVAGSGLAAAGGGEIPTDGSRARPGDRASAARVWVPARNVVLVAHAAAWAEALGADAVLVGFNKEEAETFPDNSLGFRDAFDRTLEFGTRSGVRIAAPTAELDKPQIVAQARAAGLSAEDFWSCYFGAAHPCGKCESCLRSVRAWSPRASATGPDTAS